MQMLANVPFNLGGTALLISVVVTMDFWSQVQSHLMSHQYDSLMKKSRLGGGYAVRESSGRLMS